MKRLSKRALHALLALALLLSVLLALCAGSVPLPLRETGRALLAGERENLYYRVFVHVRLPRVLAALSAGMALSVSGVLLQGVFHNVLAGPNIIGVNAGAGFAVMLAVTLLPRSGLLVPTAAFFGALGAALLIYLIASLSGADNVTVVLTGVAVSSLLTAGMDALRTLFPDSIADASMFLIGSFGGAAFDRLFPAVWFILAGLLPAMLLGRRLDILSLGDDTAASLGMNVRRTRFCFLLLASLLAGAAVSFSGLLGFVGLLVPHAVRRFTGHSHALLLPCAALAGGSFVLLCDLLGRVLFAPYELPVGILMSALGAPFFLALLLRRRGAGA